MGFLETVEGLNKAKDALKAAKKEHPEEYKIILEVASKLVGILKNDDLDKVFDLEYPMLEKDEALQIATALIRKTREEKSEFEELVKKVTYIIGLFLKAYLQS